MRKTRHAGDCRVGRCYAEHFDDAAHVEHDDAERKGDVVQDEERLEAFIGQDIG